METKLIEANKSQNHEEDGELDDLIKRIISLRFSALSKVTENIKESEHDFQNEENNEVFDANSNKNKRKKRRGKKCSLENKTQKKSVTKIWKRSLQSFPKIEDGKHIVFQVETERHMKRSKKVIYSKCYFQNMCEVVSQKKLKDLLNSFILYITSKIEQAENVEAYKIYMNQFFILRTYLKFKNLHLETMVPDKDFERARYKPLTDMLNKGNSAFFSSFKKRYLRNKLFMISDDEDETMPKENFKDIYVSDNDINLEKRGYNFDENTFHQISSFKVEKNSFEQPGLKKESLKQVKKSEYIPVYSMNENKPCFRESVKSEKVCVGILSLHQNFDDEEFDDLIYDKKKRKNKKTKVEPIPEIKELAEDEHKSENKDLPLSKEESKINTDLEDSFNLGNKNINDCPKFNGTYCSEDTIDPEMKKFPENVKDSNNFLTIENPKEINLKNFDSPRNNQIIKGLSKSKDMEDEETTDKRDSWKPFIKNFPPNINLNDVPKKLIFSKKKANHQKGSGLTSPTETKNENKTFENDFDSFEKDFEFSTDINFGNLMKKEKDMPIEKNDSEKENEEINKNIQKKNIENVERIEEESENESMSEEAFLKKLQNIKESTFLINNLLNTLPDGVKEIFDHENNQIKMNEEFKESQMCFIEFINAIIDDVKEIQNEMIKNVNT